jgi:hypothetical protein
MASRKKTPKRFGKPGGRHRKHEIRTGRPRYRVTVRRVSETNRNLTLTRKRIVRAYRSMKRTLGGKSVNNLYTVRVVSTLEYVSLKQKISKVRDVGGEGYRVVNLDCLQTHVMDITLHASLCEPARDLALQGQSPIKHRTTTRYLASAYVPC